MARFCTVCGAEIPEGASFCTECGTKAADPVDYPAAAAAPYDAALGSQPAYPFPEAQTIKPVQTYRPAQPVQQAQPYPPAQSVQPGMPAGPYQPAQPGKRKRSERKKAAAEPQPVPYPPQPAADPAGPEEPEKSRKPVSTAAFWALKLLYAIPVVGFFASLILAIAPENKNLKHHALATFIWHIVILVVLTIGGLLVWRNFEPLWEQFTDSVQEIAEDQDVNGVDDLLNSLKNG